MQEKLENMVDRVSGLLPIVNLNIVEQHNKKNPYFWHMHFKANIFS